MNSVKLILLILFIGKCGVSNGNNELSVSTNVSPAGSGEIIPESEKVFEGDEFEIKANPYFGYSFKEWNNVSSDTLNPKSIVVVSDTTITANFEFRKFLKTLSGSNSDFLSEIIAIDEYLYILGTFNSNDGDFNGLNSGREDVFLMKLDKGGQIVDINTYGGSDIDIGSSFIVDSDNNFIVVGDTRSNDFLNIPEENNFDFYLMKLNKDGEMLSVNTYGGIGGESVISIKKNGGKYYVLGVTSSNNDSFQTTTTSASNNIFVCEILENGDMNWLRIFETSNSDVPADMQIIQNEGIVISGVATSNNGIFEGGGDFLEKAFAFKLDFSGNHIWTKLFTDDKFSGIRSSTKTSDGNIVLAGFREGANEVADVYINKINTTNGDIVWENSFGGTNFDEGLAITSTLDGELFISGTTSSSDGLFNINKGFNDSFVILASANGDVLGHETFGGSGLERAGAIYLANDIVVVAGITTSSDFDFTLRENSNLNSFDQYITVFQASSFKD